MECRQNPRDMERGKEEERVAGSQAVYICIHMNLKVRYVWECADEGDVQPGQNSFPRAAQGGIQTHDTLQSALLTELPGQLASHRYSETSEEGTV